MYVRSRSRSRESLCSGGVWVQVLLKFLDFFSKFDWENSCVSLRGPVAIATLPEMKGRFDHLHRAEYEGLTHHTQTN